MKNKIEFDRKNTYFYVRLKTFQTILVHYLIALYIVIIITNNTMVVIVIIIVIYTYNYKCMKSFSLSVTINSDR